jgi:hypothetical protein
MIIIKVKGGLGNQLFQYCMGKCLASKLKTSLKFNILGYEYDKSRQFELGNFKIPKLDTDISPLLDDYFEYYREPHFNHKDFGLINRNIYFDGYWQCEKYFIDIKDILIRELVLKESSIASVNEKAKEITNAHAVAVHIRRGDYLEENNITRFGILPFEYYIKAIGFIKKRISNAQFYFFSDDIDWVKNNLKLSNNYFLISRYVTQNSIEDFHLMTKCAHHIIANSSFSWWAAWLNQNEQKIVIGPRKWFNSSVPNTKDVLPESWIAF